MRKKSIYFKDTETRPLTIQSLEVLDNNSSNVQSSPNYMKNLSQDETQTQVTGKLSRPGSQASNQTMPTISQRRSSIVSNISRRTTDMTRSVATPISEIAVQD